MIVDIYNTEQKYDLILSDPPWDQKRGGRKDVRPNSSGKELDYQTMELSDIQSHLLQATSLCNEDAVLFLWAIDKYLFEAQAIAENCGWKLHARMIWNKITGIPASFDIRFGHEYFCYICIRENCALWLILNVGRYILYSLNQFNGILKNQRYPMKS